ncbi:hypothetical protein QE152_g19033 [Popillia japonica]|uniref:Uncharacterized protein n=1 Tax=Popillia japonica TaxID=7064 RepID=A0AAW1KYV2_POPJA
MNSRAVFRLQTNPISIYPHLMDVNKFGEGERNDIRSAVWNKFGEGERNDIRSAIIWGHWILSESSNKTESIFTQRIFVDAIERIRRECKTTTTQKEDENDEEEKSTESTSTEESKSEDESTSEATSTEETSKEQTSTTEETTESTESKTTKPSKTTKSTKSTTKGKRSKSTTQATESYAQDSTEDSATEEMTGECLFADKRYVKLLRSLEDYPTTISGAGYRPEHVITKLNLVQQNLNEILGILSKHLTEPKCKKRAPPPTSTSHPSPSISTRVVKNLKTTASRLPTCIVKSRSTGQFPVDLKTFSTPTLIVQSRSTGQFPVDLKTFSTPKHSTKSPPNHTKHPSAALQNILKRLYDLDLRLGKLMNITEVETTTDIPTGDRKYSEKRIHQLKEFLRKYNSD